eukprot:6956808-Ditylum_brightwellii.AAC.1
MNCSKCFPWQTVLLRQGSSLDEYNQRCSIKNNLPKIKEGYGHTVVEVEDVRDNLPKLEW